MEVIKIPYCSKKTVPIQVIISMILCGWSLVCLITALSTPGWVRDLYFQMTYGLWQWCTTYEYMCTTYSSHSIPDTLNAVRGLMIIGVILNLCVIILISILFCHLPKYPLLPARIINFLSALSVLIALCIYTYTDGYTGGGLVKTRYHYSYALSWVGFISLTISLILLIFEKYYSNPLNIYKYVP